jgi:hypothetical protein
MRFGVLRRDGFQHLSAVLIGRKGRIRGDKKRVDGAAASNQ